MCQLKNHVGAGDHGQGKRGESIVTSRWKQPGSSVPGEERRDGGQCDDAENEWNQPAGAVRSSLHNSLFPAA